MKKALKKGRKESKIKDILDFLRELREISKELEDKFEEQDDLQILSKWVKLSARANSIEDFIQKSKIMD